MTRLTAKHILIVEDEAMIAMLLEDMVADEGGLVVGPAATLDEGLALARDAAIDGAVLDVNLAGACSGAIADVLQARGIPFLFATGYGGGATAGAHAGVPVVVKPYRLDDLATRLAGLIG